MSALSEKILRSRESVVPAGGFKFTIRRPTDLDMIEFSKTRRPADLVRFVVGWKDVTDGDLYPGGDGAPATFDAEACAEWLADRSDLMVVLVNAVAEAYQAHKTALEVAEKTDRVVREPEPARRIRAT
ncbi:hypothetical protein [Propionivibrio sp.]|uniref:hypothetical protein n=1 Tax=Propionivibrio sp. TaxID=2212460 RepID=UPI00260155B8|nr:hypothetical protein [Propionivibrio sp.]MBK8745712.1 hypothetical protein [Propionivibrio sp.]